MNLVTREEWGARPWRSKSVIRRVDGMALHWEGPPIGTPAVDECAEHVRNIQRYHLNVRKWEDIAYSFVVCPHGTVFEGRGWGVRPAANGTTEGNASFHATCYLGGTGDPFTGAAKLAIVQLVAESRRRWPDGRLVRPHSSFKPTECPGDVIRAWIATNPFDTPPPPEDDDVLTKDQSDDLKACKNYAASGDSKLDRIVALLEQIATTLSPPR